MSVIDSHDHIRYLLIWRTASLRVCRLILHLSYIMLSVECDPMTRAPSRELINDQIKTLKYHNMTALIHIRHGMLNETYLIAYQRRHVKTLLRLTDLPGSEHKLSWWYSHLYLLRRCHSDNILTLKKKIDIIITRLSH